MGIAPYKRRGNLVQPDGVTEGYEKIVAFVCDLAAVEKMLLYRQSQFYGCNTVEFYAIDKPIFRVDNQSVDRTRQVILQAWSIPNVKKI